MRNAARDQKRLLSRRGKRIVALCAVTLPVLVGNWDAAASTLFWDGDGVGPQGGGAGAWNTTSVHFSLTSGGTVDQIWNNTTNAADTAFFNGTAGAVTLAGPITVNTVTASVSGYSIGNGNGVTGAANTLTLSTVNTTHTSGTTTLTAFLSGVTLTKTGAGRLEINNSANAATNKFTLNAGAITAPAPSRFGAPASLVQDFFTFNGGGLGANTTTAYDMGSFRGVTIKSGGAFFSASTVTIAVTLGAPVVGTEGGDLNINGSAAAFTGSAHTAGCILILSNTNNSWNGNANVNTGTLRLGASGVVPDTALVTLSASTGFDMNGFDETVKSLSGTGGTVTVGAKTLTLANPAGESLASVLNISAGGKLVKNGSGAITLTGGNTNNGEIVITNGTVGVGGASIFGSTGNTGSLTISGGKLSTNNASGRSLNSAIATNIAGDFTVDDSLAANQGTITVNGVSTLKNGNRTITVNGTGSLVFAGAVGEDAAGRGLIKDGTGTLQLNNAANTYSGSTTVLNGILSVDGDGNLGGSTGVMNLSGGRLNATASRTVAVPNPLNITADTAITTSSAASTAVFDFSTNTITRTGGTLTFRNDGADAATDVFEPRFTGSGFDYAWPINIDNGTLGLTRFSSFNTTGTTQTYSGVLSGTGSYKRSASIAGTGGDTIFSGSNTYAGGTTIGDGTLTVLNTTGSGTGTGSISISSGGTLNVGAGTTTGSISGDVAMTANGALRFNHSDDITYAGIISGTGNVTKLGAGVLTLSGSSTFVGLTSILNGTLSISSASNLGASPSSASDNILIDGGALQFTNSISSTPLSANRRIVLGPSTGSGTGTIDVLSTKTVKVAGRLNNNGTGTGSLVKVGGGTLELQNAASGYTGTTTVNDGTLQTGPSGIFGAGDITNNSNLAFGNTNTYSAANVISGTGALFHNGTGTVSLSGNSSYTGPTSVTAGGTLEFNSIGNENGGNSALGNPASGNGVISLAGALRYTGAGASTNRGINLTGNGVIDNASAGIFDLAGNITGVDGFNLTLTGTGTGGIVESVNHGASSTLTKSGAGTWRIVGNNTYGGKTSVTDGVLEFSSIGDVAGGPSALGAPLTTADGQIDLAGTLRYVDVNDRTTHRNLNLTGAATLETLQGGTTVRWLGTTNTATAGADLTLSGTGDGEIFGDISTGTGSLTKRGGGQWYVSGNNNSYTGSTTILGGTLAYQTIADVGVNSSLGAPDAGHATISLAGGMRHIGATSSSNRPILLTVSGCEIGASGSGPLTLNGGVSGTNTNLSLSTGGSGSGVMGGSISIGSGVLTVIAGSSSWTLNSGASDYTGGTNVSSGKLILNNGTTGSALGSGPVAVSTFGTLAGNGKFSGALTLHGTISPGNSAGEMVTGDETWYADNGTGSGAYVVDIEDATGSPGAGGFDHLTLSSLTLSTGATGNFTIYVSATPAAHFDKDGNYSWKIVNGTITQSVLDNLNRITVDASGFLATNNVDNGGFFTVSADSDSLSLSYVPEPGTGALLVMSGFVGARRRRKVR